jgi:hypothetical protein
MRILRFLAALSLLAMGAVHLQQYIGAGYSSVPTIGTLFLLNAIGAAVLALGLMLPIGAVVRGGAARLATGSLAAAGAAMALASLGALLVSEQGTLFGFHEPGTGAPIVVAIAGEVLAMLAGSALAALCFRRTRAGAAGSSRASAWSSRSSISRT